MKCNSVPILFTLTLIFFAKIECRNLSYDIGTHMVADIGLECGLANTKPNDLISFCNVPVITDQEVVIILLDTAREVTYLKNQAEFCFNGNEIDALDIAAVAGKRFLREKILQLSIAALNKAEIDYPDYLKEDPKRLVFVNAAAKTTARFLIDLGLNSLHEKIKSNAGS